MLRETNGKIENALSDRLSTLTRMTIQANVGGIEIFVRVNIILERVNIRLWRLALKDYV